MITWKGVQTYKVALWNCVKTSNIFSPSLPPKILATYKNVLHSKKKHQKQILVEIPHRFSQSKTPNKTNRDRSYRTRNMKEGFFKTSKQWNGNKYTVDWSLHPWLASNEERWSGGHASVLCNHLVAERSFCSSNGLPINCRPIGRPSVDRPAGNDTAGTPVNERL